MADNTQLIIHYHNIDWSHCYTNSVTKIRENLNRCNGITVQNFDKHLEKDGYLFSFFVAGRFICYLEINLNDKINKMHFFDTKDNDTKAMELYANCNVTSQTFEKRFMEYYHSTKGIKNFDNFELTMEFSNLN